MKIEYMPLVWNQSNKIHMKSMGQNLCEVNQTKSRESQSDTKMISIESDHPTIFEKREFLHLLTSYCNSWLPLIVDRKLEFFTFILVIYSK